MINFDNLKRYRTKFETYRTKIENLKVTVPKLKLKWLKLKTPKVTGLKLNFEKDKGPKLIFSRFFCDLECTVTFGITSPIMHVR